MCIFKEFKGAFKLPDSTVICLMVFEREQRGCIIENKGGNIREQGVGGGELLMSFIYIC